MPDYSIQQMMDTYLKTPYDQPPINIVQQFNSISCIDQVSATNNLFTFYAINTGKGHNQLQLATGLDYEHLGQQTFTQIDTLFNYTDPTYILLGTSQIRHTGTIYDNECETTRMILGHILPLCLDNNTIIRGNNIAIQTGTWVQAVNGTDPISQAIYTSTQNDYVQFTSGSVRYLAFSFYVVQAQDIDWTIRVDGIDQIRVVSNGLTTINGVGYCIGVVIDSRTTNNKVIRIINNKTTNALQKQYINFVAGWNGNTKQVCLLNPPRFNTLYNNTAPYNSSNILNHTIQLENSLIDISRMCQSHAMNVSYYKFYANNMNLFEDNQITIALYGQKRLAKELVNTN